MAQPLAQPVAISHSPASTRPVAARRTARRGVALIYVTATFTAMTAFASLAVDYGRVQADKTELLRAADAGARYGAAALARGATIARTAAKTSASENLVDESKLSLADSDVQFGTWDRAKAAFTPLANQNTTAGANAVRVVAARSKAAGNAMPVIFGGAIGVKTCDARSEAVAVVTPPVNVDVDIQGTANPFLAGMPKGSVASLNNPHNSPDYAGDVTSANPAKWKQSPIAINSLPLMAGQPLTFDAISGTAGHDPNLSSYQPDGQLDDIGGNTNGSENGISNLVAPINALVGVFLDDAQPDSSAAPQPLDFSSSQSRDFTTLKPKVKQVFFIGDGRTSDGRTQQFIVPKGATRFYLATWDYYEWNNNYGARDVKINRPMKIVSVK